MSFSIRTTVNLLLTTPVYIAVIVNVGSRRHGWPNSRPVQFTSGKNIPVPIKQKGGWATGTVWAFWRREKSLAHAGIRNPDHPACGPVFTLTTPSWFPLSQLPVILKYLGQLSLEGNCNTLRFSLDRHTNQYTHLNCLY